MSSRSRTLLLNRAQSIRLLRGLGFVGAYAAWTLAFRLLVLTFVTYFLMSSTHPPRFEDISETFGANELTLMGMSAVLFVGILRALYPITSTTTRDVFTPERLEKYSLPGFAHGAVLATGVTLAFLVSGIYRYLGFFIQFDEAPVAALTVLVRIIALGAFAYFEEFIFRQKITRDMMKQIRGNKPPTLASSLTVAAVVGILYCGIKLIQFDLGVMQLFTIFLISVTLSVQTFIDGDFGRGAGYWAALLIVFQPLLSLPALGGDFSGLLLIKYQPGSGNDTLTRLISGGAGGPLSSVAFQALLLFGIVRGLLVYKKRLLNPETQRVN
jgi:hypothetical protein